MIRLELLDGLCPLVRYKDTLKFEKKMRLYGILRRNFKMLGPHWKKILLPGPSFYSSPSIELKLFVNHYESYRSWVKYGWPYFYGES